MGERCSIFNLLIKSKCDVKKRSAYTPITSTFTFQAERGRGGGGEWDVKGGVCFRKVMWRRGRCTPSLQMKIRVKRNVRVFSHMVRR